MSITSRHGRSFSMGRVSSRPKAASEGRDMRKASRLGSRAGAGILVVLAGTLALASPAARASVGFRDQTFGTIAWTGSTAVVPQTGTNGDLYYWWNPGG